MKLKKMAGIVAIASMLLPIAASAATVTNPNAIFDGQSQVYGNAGQSVSATFQVDVPAGQVLHAIRTKVDSQATVCTAVGAIEGAQTTDITVNITLPPNTNNGGYSLVADLFYTDTLAQAQALTGNLACTSNGGSAHVNTNAYNGGTVVNVLPSSGSNSGSNTGSSSATDALAAAVAALTAQVQALLHPVTPPAPTGNAAKCAAIAAYVNAPANTYSPTGVQLQSALLLDNPNSIPALAAGATIPMGYFGPQTHAALYAYQNTYGCH